MFGAGIAGTEDEYTYYSDNQTNGFTHFVEWSTPSPIDLKQIRLYAAGDGSFFNNEREFDRFNLLARTGTNYETVLTFTPTHPYSFVDASNQLVLDTNFPAVTASDFRAEFVQYDGHRGFDGPRIIELDGFGTVLPSTNDLFDISQGTQILTNSPIRSSSDAANMLGASIGDSSENIYTYFSDDMPTGTVHSIEWQTMSPVLLKSIRLFAAGDGVVYQNQREFDRFTLKSRAIDSTNFIEIVSFKPEHPYAFFDANSTLLLMTNVGAITGQVFRAEFEQYTSSGPYNGPRIIELDGFGEALSALVPKVTLSPLGGDFTNSLLVTITSSSTNAIIRYTLDGSIPTTNSLIYDQAITLTNSATIVASMFVDGTAVSEPATASFKRVYVLDNQIPSSWLTQYFGESYRYDWRAASTADPDSDGATNEQEYLAGTDPLNPSSVISPANLWDINSGITITAHSPTRGFSDIENMFGAGDAGTEDEYTYFSDNQPEGFTHFVEWSTPSAIDLKQVRLYASGDGQQYNNEREFDRFTLWAKVGTNYQTVFTFIPTHPYSFVDASNLLVLNTNFPAITASDFRAEFVQFDGHRGLDGPRIIELEGFGTPTSILPMTGDLFDVNQGAQVVNSSLIRPGSNASNMLGSAIGCTPERIYTFFNDGMTNGSTHFIEWQTKTPVLLQAIRLFAAGDGPMYENQREFDRFTLKSRTFDATNFTEIASFTPEHPYNFKDAASLLLLENNIGAVTGQVFRAEFVQHTTSRPYNGPRIVELDGLGEALPPLPLKAAIYPGDSVFTNSIVVTLLSTTTGSTILYTTDGSTPTTNSLRYDKPFLLTTNATIVAAVFDHETRVSEPISATFKRVYVLDDRIPSDWLVKYFGTSYQYDWRAVSNADPDDDGATNEQEYLAGTDPLDPESALCIREIKPVPMISWNSVSNRTYQVYRQNQTNQSDWLPLYPIIKATNSITTFIDVESPSYQGIYKIKLLP